MTTTTAPISSAHYEFRFYEGRKPRDGSEDKTPDLLPIDPTDLEGFGSDWTIGDDGRSVLITEAEMDADALREQASADDTRLGTLFERLHRRIGPVYAAARYLAACPKTLGGNTDG